MIRVVRRVQGEVNRVGKGRIPVVVSDLDLCTGASPFMAPMDISVRRCFPELGEIVRR